METVSAKRFLFWQVWTCTPAFGLLYFSAPLR